MPAASKFQFAAVLALRFLSSSGHANECAEGNAQGSCQARKAANDVVLLQKGPVAVARTQASAPIQPHVPLVANASSALVQESSEGWTPFSALGCSRSVPLDGNSIWEPGTNRRWYSCAARSNSGPAFGSDVHSQGAGMCMDASGKPDYTSIIVDMTATGNPVGCFAWVVDQCKLDLRRIKTLEFDVDLTQCENLWAAPIWLSPMNWVAPQGLSGEVDFVEMCPVPEVNTNLGCYSLDGKAKAGCMDGTQGSWGVGYGLNGPKHLTMTLQDSRNVNAGGDLDVRVCSVDGSNCKTVARFANYLSSVYPTRNQQYGWPYELRSDVWNAYGSDGGWGGCRAVQNPSTKCKYVVRNIKVTTSDGKPMFAGGKCMAMNA